MVTPKFVQVKKTFLKTPISASEATSFVVNELVDIYGNALTAADFNAPHHPIVGTIDPGGTDEEIFIFTGFTTAADGTVTIDTGIVRGVIAKSPYTTAGTGRAHAAGTVVVFGDNPQLYQLILDYINSVALAGAPDASTTTQGIVEEATLAEIDADTGAGATTARLFVNPAVLATSKYGTRLPSATQKTFLDGVVGAILPYAGIAAPTGFLLCDGTAYNIATYNALALVTKNYYGQNTGTTFTADAGTDFITATSHGLADGDHIFLTNVGGALPAGLSVNTSYYVRDKTTNTFKVTATVGGAAVDITGAGTGTHSFHTQFKVPDLRSSVPLGLGQRTRTMSFTGDTDVDPATDTITVTSNDWLHTGQAVALTGSSLPTGLSETTYYVIRSSATEIKLATSVANANAGAAVNITADGSGTCTLTQVLTSRVVGGVGGTETQTTVPRHTHTTSYTAEVGGSGSGGTGGGAEETIIINETGENSPNNMPPYTVVNYIIKT